MKCTSAVIGHKSAQKKHNTINTMAQYSLDTRGRKLIDFVAKYLLLLTESFEVSSFFSDMPCVSRTLERTVSYSSQLSYVRPLRR
jgi:hypothetical protein